jgi:hypothetical protein
MPEPTQGLQQPVWSEYCVNELTKCEYQRLDLHSRRAIDAVAWNRSDMFAAGSLVVAFLALIYGPAKISIKREARRSLK